MKGNDNASHYLKSKGRFDASRAVVPLGPVARLQRFDTDLRPGFRRVHELAVAEVDADVRVRPLLRVVENQIARLQFDETDRHARLRLSLGVHRQTDAPGLPIDVRHEATAIEASGGRLSA